MPRGGGGEPLHDREVVIEVAVHVRWAMQQYRVIANSRHETWHIALTSDVW